MSVDVLYGLTSGALKTIVLCIFGGSFLFGYFTWELLYSLLLLFCMEVEFSFFFVP